MWCANRPKAFQYMKDAYLVLLGHKSVNGHGGITAPWEIVMNTAGYEIMSYRQISSQDH